MKYPKILSAWLALLPLAAMAADAPLVVPLWTQGAPGSEARVHEAEVVGMHDANTPMVYNIHNP